MEPATLQQPPRPEEIWVRRIKRRWTVQARGEQIAIKGDKSTATARAFSIAQLGDGPVDVIVFQKNGSVELRRSFRS